MKKNLTLTVAVLTCLATTAFAQKTRKVLLIGIDGCTNKVLGQENTPNIQKLINTGYYASNALNVMPTLSGPNWATILTGTKVAKHEIVDNDFNTNNVATYPTFFNAIKNADATKRTASIVNWPEINNKIVNTNDVTVKLRGNDLFVDNEVVKELTEQNPDVIFCHFDGMDGVGHGTGYSPLNPKYVKMIGVIDGYIGHIVEAISARKKTHPKEEWLIAITTDHGGTYVPPAGQTSGPGRGSHGGKSYGEKNSFIILNGPGVKHKLVNQAPKYDGELTPNTILPDRTDFGNAPYTYSVAPTVLKWLKVKIPATYDGVVLGGVK